MGNENKNKQSIINKLNNKIGKIAVLILLASQTSFFMSSNNSDNGYGEFSSRFVAEQVSAGFSGPIVDQINTRQSNSSDNNTTTTTMTPAFTATISVSTSSLTNNTQIRYAPISQIKSFEDTNVISQLSDVNLKLLCSEDGSSNPNIDELKKIDSSTKSGAISYCFSCLYAKELQLSTRDASDNNDEKIKEIEELILETKTKIASKCEGVGKIDYASLCESAELGELSADNTISTEDSYNTSSDNFEDAIAGRKSISSTRTSRTRSNRAVVASDGPTRVLKCHIDALIREHIKQSDEKNAADASEIALRLLEAVEDSNSPEFLRRIRAESKKLFDLAVSGDLKNALSIDQKNELKTALIRAVRIAQAKLPMLIIQNELVAENSASEKIKSDALSFINQYAYLGVNQSDLACLERSNKTSHSLLWGLVNFSYSTNQQDQRCNYLSQSPVWRSLVERAQSLNTTKNSFETRLEDINTFDISQNIEFKSELEIAIDALNKFAPLSTNTETFAHNINPYQIPYTNPYTQLYNPGQPQQQNLNTAYTQYPMPNNNVAIPSAPNRNILNGTRASGSGWMSNFYGTGI